MSLTKIITQRNLIIFISLFISEIFSHIIVKAPKELASQFTNQTIKVGLANFGNVPYGHKIVGNIYYNLDDSDDAFGCKEIKLEGIPIAPKVDASPLLMVKRGGGCSFTQKALNIESANAHAAIIVNQNPGENAESVIMADDGRGMEVSIPSVLISKEDGDKLISYYRSNKGDNSKSKQIVLEMNFDIEHKNNTVNYTIWYTPDQESVYTLMNDLYYYHLELGDLATLKVHFLTYTHFSYNEKDETERSDCLGSGKYCMRPDKEGSGIENGRTILWETIKQICVYKYAYENNQPELFWIYLQNFYEKCILTQKFTATCASYQTKESGLPTDWVNKCMNESFVPTEDQKKKPNYENIAPNTLLDAEYIARKENYIYRAPSLFINDRLFLGSWRADYVFEGICAAFQKKPEICYKEGGFEREKKMSMFTLIFVVLLIIVVNVIIFVICMKVIKKKIQERLDGSDINRKIDTVVNSYLQMRETK